MGVWNPVRGSRDKHSSSRPLPAELSGVDRVVLFDGECNLCNAWARFLIPRDRAGRLRLAAVQSGAGQAVLAWAGLPTDRFDTMVFVEAGRAYTKSDAFLRIVRHLPWPWRAARVGLAVPRVVRNWLYDRLAANRFRLFGRRAEACLMPSPEAVGRFLR